MSSFRNDYRFRCVCLQNSIQCRCSREEEGTSLPTISIREVSHMGKTLYAALTQPPPPPYGLFSGTQFAPLYSLTDVVGSGTEGIVYSIVSRTSGAKLIAKVRPYSCRAEIVNAVSEGFICCYGDELRVLGISPHFVSFYDMYAMATSAFLQQSLPFFSTEEKKNQINRRQLSDFMGSSQTVSVTVMSKVGLDWKHWYVDAKFMVPATVFEFVWALYCMKAVCHVIPCDLHLGNVCVASEPSTREYRLGSTVYHCSERHPMPVLIDYGLYRFRFKESNIPASDFAGTSLAPLLRYGEHLESTLAFILSRLRFRDRDRMKAALVAAFQPTPFDMTQWAARHFRDLRVSTATKTSKTVWQLPADSIQDCFGRVVAPLSTNTGASFSSALRKVSTLRRAVGRDPSARPELAAVQEALRHATSLRRETQELVEQEQAERMQGNDTERLRQQIRTNVEAIRVHLAV